MEVGEEHHLRNVVQGVPDGVVVREGNHLCEVVEAEVPRGSLMGQEESHLPEGRSGEWHFARWHFRNQPVAARIQVATPERWEVWEGLVVVGLGGHAASVHRYGERTHSDEEQVGLGHVALGTEKGEDQTLATAPTAF